MILALVLCLTMASAMAEIKNTQATEFAFATIESGEIMGINYKGVYSFRGVPYATAARFQMPEKVQPWDGVCACVTWGTICPAEYGANGYTNFTEFMTPADHNFIHNEDCQNLNVWTKSLDAEAKKPVIVSLHGGGFSNGSSMELPYYSGHNITDSGDIVFVSVNHRLNVLGSLDLSAYKVSSNIPGVTCTYVEDRFEGSVVAWCSGAVTLTTGKNGPVPAKTRTGPFDITSW